MFSMVAKFFRQNSEYKFNFEQAKTKTRILLIDDERDALRLSDLQGSGYAIHQEVKITPTLLHRCESGEFDIIILDYNGIAPAAICKDDGFGVFERIRNANPEQYIIAISGQTYDVSKTEYFRKANGWLKKPTDFAGTKTIIDKGIFELFDKSSIIARARSQAITDGATPAQADKLVRELGERNFQDLESAVDLTKKICGIVQLTNGMISVLRAVRRISTTT